MPLPAHHDTPISHILEIDYSMCNDFHGYDEVVQFLEKKLITKRDPQLSKHVVVLHGHAGTGKSAACNEFYLRNQQQ